MNKKDLAKMILSGDRRARNHLIGCKSAAALLMMEAIHSGNHELGARVLADVPAGDCVFEWYASLFLFIHGEYFETKIHLDRIEARQEEPVLSYSRALRMIVSLECQDDLTETWVSNIRFPVTEGRLWYCGLIRSMVSELNEFPGAITLNRWRLIFSKEDVRQHAFGIPVLAYLDHKLGLGELPQLASDRSQEWEIATKAVTVKCKCG